MERQLGLPIDAVQRSVYSVALHTSGLILESVGRRETKTPDRRRGAGLTYGAVAWFDRERGIGGITLDEGEQQVPVHATDIDGGGRPSLGAADRVAFTLLDGPRGPRAVDVWVP
jgi:cold shock protein